MDMEHLGWCDWFVEQGRTPFVSMVCKRRGANGSEPKHILWHCDNEPLFGPQISPKQIVSMSLGYSVELQVRRRALDGVPSLIRLDHGDLLVMDGLAQLEYEHRTVSGLQGPRVNLTFRWITQHIASCPPAGVMCVLPSCAEGLARNSFRGREDRGGEIDTLLVDGPFFVNLGVFLLGTCLD